MTNLHTLQTAFKKYLLGESNEIADLIVSTPNLSSENRLAIYSNAYYARLVEILAKDYAALNYVMGNDEFRRVCLEYIEEFPSKYYSLRWFGQDLGQFLASHKMNGSQPYLAELATFEWAFVEAFDAKDVEVSVIEDAKEIPPESWADLRMMLHPSVRWVSCSWNCLEMWQSMKNDLAIPVPELLSIKVSYLMWRQGLNTTYRSLGADEAAGLELVSQGANFEKLCNSLAQWLTPEETALRAASLFKTWLADGLIIQIVL